MGCFAKILKTRNLEYSLYWGAAKGLLRHNCVNALRKILFSLDIDPNAAQAILLGCEDRNLVREAVHLDSLFPIAIDLWDDIEGILEFTHKSVKKEKRRSAVRALAALGYWDDEWVNDDVHDIAALYAGELCDQPHILFRLASTDAYSERARSRIWISYLNRTGNYKQARAIMRSKGLPNIKRNVAFWINAYTGQTGLYQSWIEGDGIGGLSRNHRPTSIQMLSYMIEEIVARFGYAQQSAIALVNPSDPVTISYLCDLHKNQGVHVAVHKATMRKVTESPYGEQAKACLEMYAEMDTTKEIALRQTGYLTHPDAVSILLKHSSGHPLASAEGLITLGNPILAMAMLRQPCNEFEGEFAHQMVRAGYPREAFALVKDKWKPNRNAYSAGVDTSDLHVAREVACRL